MFKINDNRGFSVTFDNGYTVSVQFGPGSYSSNRTEPYDPSMSVPQTAFLAETALIGPDEEFVKYDGDDVQAYRNPAEVLALLNYAAAISND
jgi:hypothetical protein